MGNGATEAGPRKKHLETFLALRSWDCSGEGRVSSSGERERELREQSDLIGKIIAFVDVDVVRFEQCRGSLRPLYLYP